MFRVTRDRRGQEDDDRANECDTVADLSAEDLMGLHSHVSSVFGRSITEEAQKSKIHQDSSV